MDADRAALKAEIIQERKVTRLLNGKLVVVNLCDLCACLNPTDLHECLISRGRARGNPELEHATLHSKYNVSLLCNPCNLQRAEIVKCRRLLISKNIDRYGYQPMCAWVYSLPFAAEAQRDEYLLLLDELTYEMKPGRWAEIEPKLWNYGPRYGKAEGG